MFRIQRKKLKRNLKKEVYLVSNKLKIIITIIIKHKHHYFHHSSTYVVDRLLYKMVYLNEIFNIHQMLMNKV